MTLHTASPADVTQQVLVPFAEWTSSWVYGEGDYVISGGSVWVAVDPVAGVAPASPAWTDVLSGGGGGGLPAGLTYEDTVFAVDGSIQINGQAWAAATSVIGGITFTRWVKGEWGNTGTIVYVNPGPGGSLSFTETTSALTITLATDGGGVVTTTDADIESLIGTNPYFAFAEGGGLSLAVAGTYAMTGGVGIPQPLAGTTPQRQPNTAYLIGDLVLDPQNSGYLYEATTNGTSSATPNIDFVSWLYDVYNSFSTEGDGGVTWAAASMITSANDGSITATGTIQASNFSTDDDANVAVGTFALDSNISGTANIAVGFQALHTLTTGINNVGVGDSVLQSLTTGSGNTAVGDAAGSTITTGTNNVAVTSGSSGSAITTGNNNVVLGATQVPVATNSDQFVGRGATFWFGVDTPPSDTSTYTFHGLPTFANAVTFTTRTGTPAKAATFDSGGKLVESTGPSAGGTFTTVDGKTVTYSAAGIITNVV